ncbi:MAG: hypothetical protein M1450_00260 [Patescibacteria group bacterium]|nr:hypothetical protein [Patescibacteria group bacterium]
MGYFNRDNRSGQRGNFRQMHKAICSSCNRECEVPFKPSGSKPVYCSSCFEKNRGSSDTRRFSDRNFNRPRFEDRSQPTQNNDQFNAINAKLDRILSLLTPSSQPNVIPPTKLQELPTPSIKPVIIARKKKKTSKKTA